MKPAEQKEPSGKVIPLRPRNRGLMLEWRKEKIRQARFKLAYVIHTLTFCLVLFVFGILSLVLPKPTESVVEKRTLAAMPQFSADALLEGSYVRDVEMHYADTFPFRDGFVSFATFMDDIKGVRVDGVRIYGTAPAQEQPPESSQPPGPPQEPSAAPAVIPPEEEEESQPQEEDREIHRAVDDGVLGEQNGSVFVYKEKGMSAFGGSDAMAEWYASVINEYAQAWGDKVQVYNLIIPTTIEFSIPESLRAVARTNPQKPNIDHIYQSLDPGIRAVDAYTEIGVHAGEYVYFNADHHWTGLGAYYAYRAFCKSADLTPLELSDYETKRIDEFYGTMYTYTKDAKLSSDYVDYYIVPTPHTAVRYDKGAPNTPVDHTVWAEYAKSPNCYSVFLHGDFPLIHVSSEAGTGRKALIVKESFGNAFAPFLIPHYDELYIVDQRYFEKNLVQFVEDNAIDDVLFVNNIFAANTGVHIEWIAGMK